MSNPNPAKIAVLDYGIGNLASAQKALAAVGADAQLTSNPLDIAAADAVVLPGVGSFGACMAAIERAELADIARAAATDGRPFMGICIGMQMMFDSSEESPGIAGLGICSGAVKRLTGAIKLPQMQWNQITVTQPDVPLFAGLDRAWMYFVHTYAVDRDDARDTVAATCDYGGSVVAAIADGSVWATQFHPEKSGAAGLRMMRNFADHVGATRARSVVGS